MRGKCAFNLIYTELLKCSQLSLHWDLLGQTRKMCYEHICSQFPESQYKQRTGVMTMNQAFPLFSGNLQSNKGQETNKNRVQHILYQGMDKLALLFSRVEACQVGGTVEASWSRGDFRYQHDRGLQQRRPYPRFTKEPVRCLWKCKIKLERWSEGLENQAWVLFSRQVGDIVSWSRGGR